MGSTWQSLNSCCSLPLAVARQGRALVLQLPLGEAEAMRPRPSLAPISATKPSRDGATFPAHVMVFSDGGPSSSWPHWPRLTGGTSLLGCIVATLWLRASFWPCAFATPCPRHRCSDPMVAPYWPCCHSMDRWRCLSSRTQKKKEDRSMEGTLTSEEKWVKSVCLFWRNRMDPLSKEYIPYEVQPKPNSTPNQTL